jgi:hypothetical protein
MIRTVQGIHKSEYKVEKNERIEGSRAIVIKAHSLLAQTA